VILYLAGNSGYERSWTSSLDLQYENQFVKYLYSFYFCTTTILTVGYGDISPKNHLEVGVVVCVEIMGKAASMKALSCLGTYSMKSGILSTS
jgi:hypothetical protein